MQHVLNLVLTGNVGNTPELKKSTDGTSYTKIALAHDHEWRSNGEKKKKTYWYDVLCWGALADIVCTRVKRGDAVLIESDEIDAFAWVAQDDEVKGRVTITASNVVHLRSPQQQ